jgi:hypothetical protein
LRVGLGVSKWEYGAAPSILGIILKNRYEDEDSILRYLFLTPLRIPQEAL